MTYLCNVYFVACPAHLSCACLLFLLPLYPLKENTMAAAVEWASSSILEGDTLARRQDRLLYCQPVYHCNKRLQLYFCFLGFCDHTVSGANCLISLVLSFISVILWFIIHFPTIPTKAWRSILGGFPSNLLLMVSILFISVHYV